MPKQKIEYLMTELHTLFGTTEPSDEQLQLMKELKSHVHDVTDSAPTDPTPFETIEVLLNNLGEDHPKTSTVLRELLNTLKNIGV